MVEELTLENSEEIMSWNNLNTKKQSIAVTVPVEDYEHLTGKRLEDTIREIFQFRIIV